MAAKPEISVVIPVFNEEACFPELLKRSLASCRQTGKSFEVIFIDDGSKDASPGLIMKASQENPEEVVGVFLNRNYGQHAAVKAGLAAARGEMIVTLDADLQNPPEEIPNVVKAMENGYDVVGTVRMDRQDTLFRRLSSLIINKTVRKVTGVDMHDYGCMLRGYRRNVVEAMLMCRERSLFIPILANSFARSTTEIDVRHAERAVGDSKYSIWKLINLQFDLLTSMTTFPLRLLSLIGGAICAVGVAFAAFLIVMRIIYGDVYTERGVFTLFAILFIFVGAQFIGMGLLGEYIGRIYQDVRCRPHYLVSKISGRADGDTECARMNERIKESHE